MGHPDLPKEIERVLLRKSEVFDALKRVDGNKKSQERVLRMEVDFRKRIDSHISRLMAQGAPFERYYTNPFVIMFYARKKAYRHVHELETDLALAKSFPSMETSAGRMVEEVALPAYGWQAVSSAMHSYGSLLDGRKLKAGGNAFICATLKSGPRTLNDDMAQRIGKGIVESAPSWAVEHNVKRIEFTYGALYGTKKQSNKKDWHILRTIDAERPRQAKIEESHKENWSICYKDGPLVVTATVRIGLEWWTYLGGRDAWLELCCALIRACIEPTTAIAERSDSAITDLPDIIGLDGLPSNFNVALLQRSQLEWALFLARHFSDGFAKA